MNKKKIFNDPVYGFITVPSELIFDIINHPYFQRLRRIKQLGLTDYVYPGALHTRFHHALGAMHLMGEALQNLRTKGHEISDNEFESAQIAILLHDIGHGPFSHALEHTLTTGIAHEQLSLLIMQNLNSQFSGKLALAIDMFTNTYERQFFSQLISSQLDIDRMDYLQRDCFFTGVSEGTIGANRIIKMLDIHENNLVVEEKGIYSVENFLNARRLMYWQVYLHKTAISAEQMLILILRRAKTLIAEGEIVTSTPGLAAFLQNDPTIEDFKTGNLLNTFTQIDDYDVWGGIKLWAHHKDKVLSTLSQSFLDRRLFRIDLVNEAFSSEYIKQVKNNISSTFDVNSKDSEFLYTTGSISNEAYISQGRVINILTKKGKILDVAQASDLPNIKAISKIVRKFYLCQPKNVS